ncbi:hypothetical protein AGLY_017858 [Aphis glycines]|uniref:Uncharacterized protein n=1 Tax=Aphis glycines TaxID=307491 RepID=A0A6G0SVR5_APHGL|nr:hypothetical protein AGLY_017858 [Aphis glycines]
MAESEVVKRENKSILNLRSLDDPIGRSVKHDCSVEIVYSTNDYQCSRLCRGPGKYFSKNGACVNSILKNVNEAKVQTGCDPKSGLLAYIVGDAQFGAVRLQCLSVDPGVRPDDMNKPNKILFGGTVSINYLEKFPDFTEGKCNNPKHVIVAIPNTSTIRSTGICVPKSFESALS